MSSDDPSSFLRELEQRLHSIAGRRNMEIVQSLLADDFVEFGSSGKQETIAALQSEHASGAAFKIAFEDFKVKRLAPHLCLATYRSTYANLVSGETRQSLRSSIWRHDGASWQIVFHQGTAIPNKAGC